MEILEESILTWKIMVKLQNMNGMLIRLCLVNTEHDFVNCEESEKANIVGEL